MRKKLLPWLKGYLHTVVEGGPNPRDLALIESYYKKDIEAAEKKSVSDTLVVVLDHDSSLSLFGVFFSMDDVIKAFNKADALLQARLLHLGVIKEMKGTDIIDEIPFDILQDTMMNDIRIKKGALRLLKEGT